MLYREGMTPSEVRAQLSGGRWQSVGLAIVKHNGPLTRRQRWDAALVNAGPRSALTGFTAAELHGLVGWSRDWVDVLVPVGVPVPEVPDIDIRIHRTRLWSGSSDSAAYRVDQLPHALVVTSRGFRNPRPACGLLAAAVQQRLVTPAELLAAVSRPTCTRHRRVLTASLHDIAGGTQALSELDFVRICRRGGLPRPQLQAVRRDRDGARRYLDAYWDRADGPNVIAEVDGAIHLDAMNWWADQKRQNALSLDGAIVLRFPSLALRIDEAGVVAQLRAALRL
jgi:hypothetical protein